MSNNDKFKDCRALSENDFQKFCSGTLSPFVTLVKKHDELEMCFRGNDTYPCACIYYNNHVILRVHANGKTVISFHHARYSECWLSYYVQLAEFGFKGSITNKNFKDHRKYKDVIKEIKVAEMTANKTFSLHELERLYEDILKPMFIEYFNAAGKKDVRDYFKYYIEANEEKSGYKVTTVPDKLEKIRQQALFSKMTYLKDGYFFYDMEFSQKHKNINELKADKDNNQNNQPDMLAIKFGNDKKPEKIVLVEVKSKEGSLRNKSGINDHLEKMKSYIDPSESKYEDERENRKKEACQIINHYAQLGLRGLDNTVKFEYDNDFKDLDFQILLVFTDDSITTWNKRFRETIEKYELELQNDSFISNLNLEFKAEFWKTKN